MWKIKNWTDLFPEFHEGARVPQAGNVNTWEGSLREASVLQPSESQLCCTGIPKHLGLEGNWSREERQRSRWDRRISRGRREAASRQMGGAVVDRAWRLSLSFSCGFLPDSHLIPRGWRKLWYVSTLLVPFSVVAVWLWWQPWGSSGLGRCQGWHHQTLPWGLALATGVQDLGVGRHLCHHRCCCHQWGSEVALQWPSAGRRKHRPHVVTKRASSQRTGCGRPNNDPQRCPCPNPYS